ATREAQEAARRRNTDYLIQRNDKGEAIGGTAVKRAQDEAKAEIERRGGSELLSRETQDSIKDRALAQEAARSKRELIDAERQLIAATHDDISSSELHKKTRENVDAVLRGEAKA